MEEKAAMRDGFEKVGDCARSFGIKVERGRRLDGRRQSHLTFRALSAVLTSSRGRVGSGRAVQVSNQYEREHECAEQLSWTAPPRLSPRRAKARTTVGVRA
jgi:hypothetical protein